MCATTNKNQRVLTPSDGMWLYNEKEKIISDLVFLGVEANESDWVEITSEEKSKLEDFWNEDEASKEDLYNALARLGVER